jgi:CheY-like chemotaxis protein
VNSDKPTKIKVLIVEDEETSLHVLTLALQRHNRELFFARDGEEAVRLATSERPDLIVMDMMLPKLDGFDATRRIKSDPALAAIPVIALTARTGDCDERKAREAGCDDYVTKPYRIDHLRARLAQYLG